MTFIKPPAPGVTDMQSAAAQALLGASACFAGAPAAALAELARHAALRHYADGSELFHEGAPASHWWLVAQGAVEVLRHDAAGEERMLRRLGRGEAVALAALFMPHGRYPLAARAHGATAAWCIPRGALHAACERHPGLALALLRAQSQRLYERMNEVDWLTRSNAPERLAAYLLAQPRQAGTHIALPTSQRQLAAQLGIRSETLSRLLAQWQSRGWIRGARRHWQLCDARQLEQWAAPGARPF